MAAAVVEFRYGSLAGLSAPGFGQPLRLGLGGLYSARRGGYRVIYCVDDDRRRVNVVAVEHRSDI